jgi:hypothetical protein
MYYTGDTLEDGSPAASGHESEQALEELLAEVKTRL